MESRGIFLDISKAFDGVWYDGWLFKSKLNGVNGNLLGLTKSFLRDRAQRVTVNGQTSDWKYILAGIYFMVSFFLIYINDLATELKSNVKLVV